MNHDNKVTSFDLAKLDGIAQRHRNSGRAGVTVFLDDHVALHDRNVAPLGGDLNLGLADLGEERLINLIYRETALMVQAPQEEVSVIGLAVVTFERLFCRRVKNKKLAPWIVAPLPFVVTGASDGVMVEIVRTRARGLTLTQLIPKRHALCRDRCAVSPTGWLRSKPDGILQFVMV